MTTAKHSTVGSDARIGCAVGVGCLANFDAGYHLSVDLVDESIRMLADHQADCPDKPWLMWLAFGAAHAPHQAPAGISENTIVLVLSDR